MNRRKNSLKFGLTAAVAVILSACVSTSPSMDMSTMSADERVLASYAGENYVQQYAVQAGAVGAVGGALIGCMLAEATGGRCADGAMIGGGIGAVGGAVYGAEQGRQTAQLAQAQLGAEQSLSIAQAELENARESNRAARLVVAQQQRHLEALRRDARAGTANRDQRSAALEDARRAEALIGGSRERVRASISDIEAHIVSAPSRQGTMLQPTLSDLRAQEASLDAQLAALTIDISETETLINS